jgi:hypothetical protein
MVAPRSIKIVNHFKSLLQDYELPAKQSYFATSDGINSYDGVCGNVKRRLTRYNLQNPAKNQITTTVI